MFGSTVLEVGAALCLVFLAISLTASAIVEAIASILKLRARTLLRGVKDLLNDPNFNDLAADLYGHALINPRGPGLSDPRQGNNGGAAAASVSDRLAGAGKQDQREIRANIRRNKPSYIAPRQFAAALTDVLSLVEEAGRLPTVADLQRRVDARLPAAVHPQLNQFLNGVILRTGGELAAIRGELAAWFDNAMDRVGGAYKRQAQLVAFLAALAISAGFNVDALRVAQRVWQQPLLTKDLTVGATAQDTLRDDFATAKYLPIGWAGPGVPAFWNPSSHRPNWPMIWPEVIGWLVTALASLFGAPFWFDALQQVIRLKGSGPSPDEKSKDTAAAA